MGDPRLVLDSTVARQGSDLSQHGIVAALSRYVDQVRTCYHPSAAAKRCWYYTQTHSRVSSTPTLYCDCPSGAAPVWEWALAMWNRNTGEKLQRTHAVVFLGDRGQHTRAETEEAWRATHAVITSPSWWTALTQ